MELTIKEAHTTTHYVWRTRGDDKVKAGHAANDGKVFFWDNPPPTGHPGQKFGCRCRAEPFMPGKTEFAYFHFSTSLASSYDRWSTRDFLRHYYFGGGRPVDLLETGHLREIAEQYAFGHGAFRRLAEQIADEARKSLSETLTYDFAAVYNFGSVDFAHGDGTVSGWFIGSMELTGHMLAISGETRFTFSDEFKDPLDLHIEPGGKPYEIAGNWKADFSAQVCRDRTRSNYFQGNVR